MILLTIKNFFRYLQISLKHNLSEFGLSFILVGTFLAFISKSSSFASIKLVVSRVETITLMTNDCSNNVFYDKQFLHHLIFRHNILIINKFSLVDNAVIIVPFHYRFFSSVVILTFIFTFKRRVFINSDI